jgi:hypothetical protein
MLLLISVALTAVLRVAHASCETTVPNTPVKETWCSTVLDSNNTSGVVVAKYGVPATTTLVTAATNGSIWYDWALMFLGGGIYDVFAYVPSVHPAPARPRRCRSNGCCHPTPPHTPTHTTPPRTPPAGRC